MRIARTLLGLWVVTLLVGCANLPIWTDDEPSEVSQGDEYHKKLLEYTPELQNEKLSALVSQVGNKLAAVSDRPTLKWQFTVLDSPVENAFATMGGHVYITRGLLVYLRNEDDLAAVLAHEIAHICRRDVLHAHRRADATALAAIGVMVAAPITILFPQAIAAPMGMGLSAVNRSAETAADQLGTTYLTRAGYPAEAMQDAFDVLISIEAYKKSLGNVREGWWHRAYAQHPETTRRQERVAAATGSQRTEVTETTDMQFLMLLDGVEVGNAAGEGIPHEGKRYFPELGISVEVPNGWRAQAFRGAHGAPSGVWLGSEKSGSMVIHKRPIADLAKNVCDSMEYTFKTITLEERVPLRGSDTSTCTTLGARTFQAFFSKKTYWQRVGIIRLDDEYYLTFAGHLPGQKDDDAFSPADQNFLAVAKSIVVPPAKKVPDRPRLRIYRAKTGDSFEKLAQTATMPGDSVRQLRALNIRSPEENIVPGDVIKVVK